MNRELTALDVPGRITEINHLETDIEYIHKYETHQNLDKTEEEIQDNLDSIKGILDVETQEITGSSQYKIQVSLEDKDAVKRSAYQQALNELTAHNSNYSLE